MGNYSRPRSKSSNSIASQASTVPNYNQPKITITNAMANKIINKRLNKTEDELFNIRYNAINMNAINFEDFFDREIIIEKNKLVKILKLRITPKGNLQNQLLLSKLIKKIRKPKNKKCNSYISGVNYSSTATIEEFKELVLCGKIKDIDTFLLNLVKLPNLQLILYKEKIVLPNLTDLNKLTLEQKKYLIKFLVFLRDLLNKRNNYNLRLSSESNSDYYNMVKTFFEEQGYKIIGKNIFNENLYIFKTILGDNETALLKAYNLSKNPMVSNKNNLEKQEKIRLALKMLLLQEYKVMKSQYKVMKSRCNEKSVLGKGKFFGIGTQFRKLTGKENEREITVENKKITWKGDKGNRKINLTNKVKLNNNNNNKSIKVTQNNGTCHKFRTNSYNNYEKLKNNIIQHKNN